MDNRAEIQGFLASPRARVTPQQAACTAPGTSTSTTPTADALALLASWAAAQDLDAVTSGAPA